MKSHHHDLGNLPSASISRRDAIRLIPFGLSFCMLTTTLAAASAPAAGIAGKKPLVVYFSMPETDDPDAMTREEDNSTVVIDGKVLGNTQYVAQLIQELTGADIFRILPQKAYPKDHRTLVDLAEKEQEQKARPAIAGKIENLAAYETIFLGYPNWWASIPMPVASFLEEYDFSGKKIVLFATSGGSGFGNTVKELKPSAPGAEIVEGKLLNRANKQEIEKWVKSL